METRVDIDNLIKVFERKGGNVSATCTALGISRQTFYKYKNTVEGLGERLSDVKESLVDFAESKLIERVNDGDLTAIIFYLKTQGKNRGYVERTESDVNLNQFEQLMMQVPDED